MGNIASINFKDFNIEQALHQLKHNDRTAPPKHLVGSGDFACDRSSQEAKALMDEMIKNAKINYTKHTGQKFQAKNYLLSAVANLKADSTMDDVKNLAQYFKDTHGLQCYQMAVHKDEGHIDDDGAVQYNYHAHLEFVALDEITGKNHRRTLSRMVLRRIQRILLEF